MKNFLSSLFGWLFHGCWHQYTNWSSPFSSGRGIRQSRTCLKCGRVSNRTVRYEPTVSGGYKPKKPDSPPEPTNSTPLPPTGGTGESLEGAVKDD